jgi:hypothetical protein
MRPTTSPVFLLPSTQKLRISFLLAAIIFAVCVTRAAGASESPRLTPERAAVVDRVVRAFVQTVAHGVTQDGPTAWLKYFDSGPAFFMAVNGQMAFPNPVAAQEGTRKFAQTITHIELRWGDDLRVDPLAADLAMVAASWHETTVDVAGHKAEDAGYFTALAEYREGRWQFRDAHWSSPLPTCH